LLILHSHNFCRYQDDSTVRVSVGPAKASFSVHKNLVCKISPFFRGACNSLFKEALNDEIYLPEQDPEAFDIFLEWLYTRLIRFFPHPLNEQDIAENNAWWILVTQMYVLAQYLQITSFGNDVIDLIGRSIAQEQVLRNPQSEAIDLLYNSTIGGCGLRRLYVALSVWRTNPDSFTNVKGWKAYLEGCPAEYSHDLVISLQRKNHQLDEDPFVNEQACQVFRDAGLEWQAIRPAVNNQIKTALPTKKLAS
jgi:BTB/POZ domain